MGKERLEEIRSRMIVTKQQFKYSNSDKSYWENVYTLIEQDMKYLFDTIIQQDERVQELKRQNTALKTEVDGWLDKAIESHEYMKEQDKVLDNFRQQSKRYRETIYKAVASFNQDEHQRGMSFLLQALEEIK